MQLTPGHAVTPRAPTGTARRPGMNDQKAAGVGSSLRQISYAERVPEPGGQAARVWLINR